VSRELQDGRKKYLNNQYKYTSRTNASLAPAVNSSQEGNSSSPPPATGTVADAELITAATLNKLGKRAAILQPIACGKKRVNYAA
jgi:hypothetical protein